MKITSAQVGARVEVLIEGASPAFGHPDGSYIAAQDQTTDGSFEALAEAGEKLAADARAAEEASKR